MQNALPLLSSKASASAPPFLLPTRSPCNASPWAVCGETLILGLRPRLGRSRTPIALHKHCLLNSTWTAKGIVELIQLQAPRNKLSTSLLSLPLQTASTAILMCWRGGASGVIHAVFILLDIPIPSIPQLGCLCPFIFCRSWSPPPREKMLWRVLALWLPSACFSMGWSIWTLFSPEILMPCDLTDNAALGDQSLEKWNCAVLY